MDGPEPDIYLIIFLSSEAAQYRQKTVTFDVVKKKDVLFLVHHNTKYQTTPPRK